MTWSRTSHRRYRTNRARVIRNSTVCAICGGDLNPDIPWPDKWCVTADHITPVSDARDERERRILNLGKLQAVHRICNQRRWQHAGEQRHGRAW